MAEKKFKSLVLNSTFDEISKLEPYLEDMQNWGSLNDEEYDRIRLAANEAVTNAIIHGNGEDPARKVYITAMLNDEMLRISVQDEGEGFDPSSLPDPLDQENLLNESGRGLFLIRQYSDKVEFDDHPNRLIIYFSLED